MLQVNNGRTDTPIRVRLVVHALVFDPGPPRLARYVSERASHWTKLYLHADRSLSAAPAVGSGAVEYTYDPSDPTPTVGGAISSGEPVMHAGAFDQSGVARRSDVMVFATPPLEEELEVTGPVTRLWIASDSPDTDFTAKLIDVYPPSADYPHGFAINLTEGVLRVRYRDSWGAAGTNGAGRGLCDHDRAVSNRQFVWSWAPPAAGFIEQQLPAFRRQPEFR